METVAGVAATYGLLVMIYPGGPTGYMKNFREDMMACTNDLFSVGG
jgi:hypothetical protein